ncbi:hypothetical protein RHSIM_RhsimUnG0213700 [Rhododendron simsii]|uniref:GST C-terminal domain-containing protein n=1 Tax=Rhododendron simsii TaxID=118357 RepID=A0A834L3Z9_RHOSS|nr:hypothetical protein RHSIM_RhsimUnG0213700 [Rhododendron simsii]
MDKDEGQRYFYDYSRVVSINKGAPINRGRGGKSHDSTTHDGRIGIIGGNLCQMQQREGFLRRGQHWIPRHSLWSGLAWLRVVEMMTDVKLLDEAKMPGLFAWAERFCSHGAVKDVVPGTEKLFNVAKMITAIAKAQ